MNESRQKEISRNSYHKNKARVARRRILLAIATGKCVLEKTLVDEDNFYKWTDAEKRVLQACIDKRRTSYLTLPEVQQIADRRYLRRLDIPNGRVPRYQVINKHRKESPFETDNLQTESVEDLDVIEEDVRLVDIAENADTIEEYKERTRQGKLIKRPEILSEVEPHLKWENSNSELTISVEMMAALYDSLYTVGKRKRKNNDRQKKINYGIYTRLFELLEIDNLIVVYEQPKMALEFIRANSKYLSMTPFVHVIISFIFHLEKGNFNSYISENLNVCWLYRLTRESMKLNEKKKICRLVANEKDPIIDQNAILLLKNDLKQRQTIDMQATTKRLAIEPYFDWQSICMLPELIKDDDNISMKNATYRVLLALYTREFVARDDYGGLLVYRLLNDFKIKKNVFEQNSFLEKKARNVIIRVQDVQLVNARKIYSTIDDHEFFKYEPVRYVYKPTYYSQSKKMKQKEFRYILYMLDHKTYEGFKLDPVILTEITSDYIEQLLDIRTKGNVNEIPLLPSSSTVLPTDMFLFVKEHDKQPYAHPWKLGPFITRMFGELTGTHISINDLRHSYATYFRTTDGGSENIDTIIKSSNRMFHTPNTHVAFYTHTSNTVYLYRSTKNTKALNTFIEKNKLESERPQQGPPYKNHLKTLSEFNKAKTITIHYLKASNNIIITNKQATIIDVSESEYVEGDSATDGKIIITQVDVSGEPLRRILQKIKIEIEGHSGHEFVTNSTLYTHPNEKIKFCHLINKIIDINANVFSNKQHSNFKCRQTLNQLLKRSSNNKQRIATLREWMMSLNNGSYDESTNCLMNLSYKGQRLFSIEIERLLRTFTNREKKTQISQQLQTFFPKSLKHVRLLLNDKFNENDSNQFALVPTGMLKTDYESTDCTFYPTLTNSMKTKTCDSGQIRFVAYNELKHFHLQTLELMAETKRKRREKKCDYVHYEPVLYHKHYKKVISNFKKTNHIRNERLLNTIYPRGQNEIRNEIGIDERQKVYDLRTQNAHNHLSFFKSVKQFVDEEYNDEHYNEHELRKLNVEQLKSKLLTFAEQQYIKQKNVNQIEYDKSIQVLRSKNKCTASISESEISLFCKCFGVTIKVWSPTDIKWIEYYSSRDAIITILLTRTVIKV